MAELYLEECGTHLETGNETVSHYLPTVLRKSHGESNPCLGSNCILENMHGNSGKTRSHIIIVFILHE